jgi:hypothetical protein
MTPRTKRFEPTDRRNLIIDAALWRKLKAQAEKDERTISALVRVILKEYLDRK